MPSVADAAAVAESLPEVTVGSRYGNRTWMVKDKGFAWERPFTRADLTRFGSELPPAGPILAVAVADLNDKEATLALSPAVFDIEHFKNYPAVLVQLDQVDAELLQTVIEDSWLARAPVTLAQAYLESRG